MLLNGPGMALRVGARVGVDIVHIPRIKEMLSNITACERVFTKAELKNQEPSHLSGIFAAKEAVFKALGSAPQWLGVEVRTEENGRPKIMFLKSEIKSILQDIEATIGHCDVSISHEGDYAIAIAIICLEACMEEKRRTEGYGTWKAPSKTLEPR